MKRKLFGLTITKIGLLLFAIKVLSVARTGIDTYAVTHDLLDVALIDGMFFAFWVILSVNSTATSMVRLRAFALVVCVVAYGFMLYIGWQAHHTVVAFGVRIAPAFAVAYDAWDLIQDYGTARKRNKPTQAEKRARMLERIHWQADVIAWNILGRMVAGVRAFKLVFDYYTQEPIQQATVQSPQARVLPASSSIPREQTTPLTYTQTAHGWIWSCVCGATSKDSKRGKAYYASERQAQRGGAGHAGKHTEAEVVSMLEPVEVA